MNSLFGRLLRFALSIFLWTAALICVLWSAGAIYHFDLISSNAAIVLCGAYVCFVAAMFWSYRQTDHWPAIGLGTFASVWLLTLLQQPSHRRDWVAEQSRLPVIKVVDDSSVTIKNFRSCTYQTETDFDVRYRDVQFEVADLKRVWFIVQYFSDDDRLAHVMLSFEMDADSNPERAATIVSDSNLDTADAEVAPQYFSLSVEVRREIGEVYSPLSGMFREYELNYVIGDESDIVGVRTVMRSNDRVYMYPVNADAQQVQSLFRDIATRVNDLDRRPEFYHTFFNNCLNSIVAHTYQLTPEPINWLDPRIVLPGYSDHFAWSEGLIGDDQETFEEFKVQHRIDELARQRGIDEDFSEAIRVRHNR